MIAIQGHSCRKAVRQGRHSSNHAGPLFDGLQSPEAVMDGLGQRFIGDDAGQVRVVASIGTFIADHDAVGIRPEPSIGVGYRIVPAESSPTRRDGCARPVLL